jgi:hypothetical protein
MHLRFWISCTIESGSLPSKQSLFFPWNQIQSSLVSALVPIVDVQARILFLARVLLDWAPTMVEHVYHMIALVGIVQVIGPRAQLGHGAASHGKTFNY